MSHVKTAEVVAPVAVTTTASATPAAAKVVATQPAPRARKRAATAKPAVKQVKAPTVAAAVIASTEVPAVVESVPAEKAKKPKLVRDSFTIPKGEYAVLDALKQRATALAQPAKKSEVLRAGIKALAALSDEAFLAALRDVPAIKTGRPESATPKAKAKD
ncbi:hypothetical protein [Leptothrix ochracea]|uniref:hypothetical protein n=1 Tax=Leptothrix ochracea TaxID=735331 RepID=UPI0034E21843